MRVWCAKCCPSKITDFGRLSYWRDEEVQEGDTLPMVLARIGVSEQNIQDFVQNSPINLKALKLNEGKIVSARIDENQKRYRHPVFQR